MSEQCCGHDAIEHGESGICCGNDGDCGCTAQRCACGHGALAHPGYGVCVAAVISLSGPPFVCRCMHYSPYAAGLGEPVRLSPMAYEPGAAA